MSTQTTPNGFPTELLHSILTAVIARSIYNICMSDDASASDLNTVTSLASVSFIFREITQDIASKAFNITPLGEKRPTIIADVREKLKYLKSFGSRCRNPSSDQTAQVITLSDRSYMMQAYSLFLTATALRRNAMDTQDRGNVFGAAGALVLRALEETCSLCEKAQPKGIADLLGQAAKNEIIIVNICKLFFRGRTNLEKAFKNMDTLSDTGRNPQQVDAVKIEIHRALQDIESANSNCCTLVKSGSDLVPSMKHPISQLQGLFEAVRVCTTLELDLDEYAINSRANDILEGWKSFVRMEKPAPDDALFSPSSLPADDVQLG